MGIHEGRITDGTNTVGGLKTVTFRIFDDFLMGNLLYEETDDVTLVDGLFATPLGDNPSVLSPHDLRDALLFAGTNGYLELTVDLTVLSPRERISSTPFALHAARLPEDYGIFVECDGVEDEIEIQAPIDRAITNGGGRIVLPRGICRITSTIVVKDADCRRHND